jgi:outer membrane autotransporter protein
MLPFRPDFRPETSHYAAIPALALAYGRTLLDTLHERVGEEEHLRARSEPSALPYNNGTWGRVIAQHGNRDGDTNGIFGAGPRYDYDFGAFQIGQDLYRWQQANGYRTHAGVYEAIGGAHSGVTHFDGARAGDDTFMGYSVGGYWTTFGPTGWYLDSVLQGTFYDMNGNSNRLPALHTEGWGLGASLEGGAPFRLGGGWLIEPQAQLVYQAININEGSDIGATVRFDDVNSLAGRIGVRIANTFTMPVFGSPSLVTAWFRPNLWHEFLGDPKTLFSSETGFIPFRADLGGSWVELNTGISAQINRTTSVYANASYQIGVDGDSTAWDGKVGVRFNW